MKITVIELESHTLLKVLSTFIVTNIIKNKMLNFYVYREKFQLCPETQHMALPGILSLFLGMIMIVITHKSRYG